jgi:hypothetical protein
MFSMNVMLLDCGTIEDAAPISSSNGDDEGLSF